MSGIDSVLGCLYLPILSSLFFFLLLILNFFATCTHSFTRDVNCEVLLCFGDTGQSLTSSLPQLPASEMEIRALPNLAVVARGQDAQAIARHTRIAAMKVV